MVLTTKPMAPWHPFLLPSFSLLSSLHLRFGLHAPSVQPSVHTDLTKGDTHRTMINSGDTVVPSNPLFTLKFYSLSTTSFTAFFMQAKIQSRIKYYTAVLSFDIPFNWNRSLVFLFHNFENFSLIQFFSNQNSENFN